ncbi:hypothetical protein BHM03_00051406, partial [Ensete ventricosum]
VEAAYDMLLMQRLSRRRAGKVANGNIRYADIKPIRSTGTGALPEWLQKTVKNIPVSVESPSTNSLGIQAGVYGALTVLTFVSGSSPASAGPYTGADVPGLILATSFGASLYFLSKKKISLVVITIGGLVVGAVIGSAVEQWLQVDIVPFYGIHSPAVIVTEFILFSQFLVSLYLRLFNDQWLSPPGGVMGHPVVSTEEFLSLTHQHANQYTATKALVAGKWEEQKRLRTKKSRG